MYANPQFDLRQELERAAAAMQTGAQMRDEMQRSTVVKFLLAKAYAEYLEAIDEFVGCDPMDQRLVVAIHSKMKRHREMAEWIGAALQRADQATKVIVDELRQDHRLPPI